jgi:biotin carboxyl carrier protein
VSVSPPRFAEHGKAAVPPLANPHPMAEKPETNGTSAAALSRFVAERVTPLAKAFAATPLMELRVRTSEGSIRLVKAVDAHEAHAPAGSSASRPARSGHRPVLMTSDESGRPYDTISAEVVGIFSAAPDLPAPGSAIADDRVLGYIEALKLKHPVRTGGPCALVAQVAEDGQAVDFGEALFVVDRAAQPAQSAPPVAAPVLVEALEPPRL